MVVDRLMVHVDENDALVFIAEVRLLCYRAARVCWISQVVGVRDQSQIGK